MVRVSVTKSPARVVRPSDRTVKMSVWEEPADKRSRLTEVLSLPR